MKSLRFAHDANLKFPLQEEGWKELFLRFAVESVGYDDMGQLTEALVAHQFTTAFLPAANCYYLRKDPLYQGVGIALIGHKQEAHFKSLLVVKKGSGIESWNQLQGKRLAYVHRYCTSSYFAPALLIARQGASIHAFFSQMVVVEAWQKQIDAVLEGKADATMVMEEVWMNNAKNSETTQVIDEIDNLPAPVILMSREADPAWHREFLTTLLRPPTQPVKEALFSGFAPYPDQMIASFFKKAEKALR